MADHALIDIVVQPRASRAKLGPMRDGRLRVAVTAPPVDGEANAAVIEVMADALGVPKRDVTIARGHTGKRKTVRVAGVTAAAAAALIATLVGCTGTQGDLQIGLVTAPGSTVMDAVQTLTVTLTEPTEVHTVTRDGGGFALSLDLGASGTSRAILVDGSDTGGTVVAAGASPLVPFAPSNASVTIYMAAPMSMAAAPVALPAARSELGVAALSFGAIVVGGRDGAGAPSGALEIYNAYTHALDEGLALPAPRAAPTVAVTRANDAYIFGGSDGTGAATGTLVQFKRAGGTNGAYLDLGDHPELARTGAIAALTAVDQFVVSGMPAAEIGGGAIVARTDVAALPATGAAITSLDGSIVAIFAGAGAGDTGLVRFRVDAVDAPTGGDATVSGARATSIGAAIVLVGGERAGAPIDEVVAVDPVTAIRRVVHGLATPRTGAAVAMTARFVVVAGGTDTAGALVGTVEVLDATSLAHVATIPLVAARTGAQAVALPTGQILIAGGVDATGAPIATLELFTPPN